MTSSRTICSRAWVWAPWRLLFSWPFCPSGSPSNCWRDRRVTPEEKKSLAVFTLVRIQKTLDILHVCIKLEFVLSVKNEVCGVSTTNLIRHLDCSLGNWKIGLKQVSILNMNICTGHTVPKKRHTKFDKNGSYFSSPPSFRANLSGHRQCFSNSWIFPHLKFFL